MSWPTAKRNLIVSITLIGCGLGVCGWQFEEHVRFQREAAQALVNRGREITSTLGVVIRSQRRNRIVVPMERLQESLEALIRPEELESVAKLESIAILSAAGEPIVSAGQPVELTQEMLRSRGVFWGDQSLIIMNVMDLGPAPPMEDGVQSTAALVTTNDRMTRAFTTAQRRRFDSRSAAAEPSSTPPATDVAPAGTAPVTAVPGPVSSPTVAAATVPASTPANAPTANPATAATAPATTPPPQAAARPLFNRPPWMERGEWETMIQKQGVHSLMLSMSTIEMRRAVLNDLWLRSLVSLLALGGSVLSVLAWRNVTQNSELQIRLIKAGEMNTHLKEMNFAAAGLAHETRNPLNLIRGLAQMITMEAASSPKLKGHASTILEEADRVTVQLNEFINYSKPREAHLAPVDVKRLVADVARTLVPDIEEKQITLKQPDSALRIEADEQLLRQALFNVLINAIQAVSPGGQIEIKLTQVGPREALLDIADDGPGVPAAERVNIFKPYVTMRPKGVGLGLAIVHQIASAHHWDVACGVNEPHGALFRFTRIKLAGQTA